MYLENSYLKVDEYRIYPNKEAKKLLDREFDFYYRLREYLIKKMCERFNITRFDKWLLRPTELRPFILGIIKNFRKSTKYNFSKYFAEDHFDFAAKSIFYLYEYKKIKPRGVIDKKNIIDVEHHTICLSPKSLNLKWNRAVFSTGTKAAIRPKNKEFRSYKNMYITRENGKYIIHCHYYKAKIKLPYEALACGIDLGVRTNFTIFDSNGNVTQININRDVIDKNIDKIVFYQRTIKEILKKNGNVLSKNVAKLRQKVTNCYERLHRSRTYQYNRVADLICRKYKYICIESISLDSLHKKYEMRTQYNKYSFSEFQHALEHRAERYGRIICWADRFYKSSQICSSCGVVHKEMRNESNFKEMFDCECGLHVDRDINAAKNLLHYVYEKMNLKDELNKETGSNDKVEHFKQLSLFDFSEDSINN